MTLKKIILGVLFTINTVVLFAQDTTKVSNNDANQFPKINLRNYSSLLVDDFYLQAKSPFELKKKQVVNLVGFTIITAGLVAIDGNIDKGANYALNNSLAVKKASPYISEFGSNYGIGFVGVFTLYGMIFKDNRAQATGLLATQAMITSGVWTRLGKIISGRERPSAAYTNSFEESGVWHGPGGQLKFDTDLKKLAGSNYDAFPSGHTATAFSIATVFAKMYSDKPAVPIIAYAAATTVGLSRLTEHAHWMSDVFVGAALGYLCGDQVVNNYRKFFKVKDSKIKPDISISLNYSDKQFFSSFVCKF